MLQREVGSERWNSRRSQLQSVRRRERAEDAAPALISEMRADASLEMEYEKE